MRLRVGVIGLGRRWRRYRPILARLRDHIEVRTVCDQVARRAEIEARRLRCTASAGPVELLERGDVEAALLLDPQWFGLWPLEHACRAKKPVFCALSPDSDDAHADALHQQIQESGLPVFLALGPVLAPATMHLRELLTHRLGRAQPGACRLGRDAGAHRTSARSLTQSCRTALAGRLCLADGRRTAERVDDRWRGRIVCQRDRAIRRRSAGAADLVDGRGGPNAGTVRGGRRGGHGDGGVAAPPAFARQRRPARAAIAAALGGAKRIGALCPGAALGPTVAAELSGCVSSAHLAARLCAAGRKASGYLSEPEA